MSTYAREGMFLGTLSVFVITPKLKNAIFIFILQIVICRLREALSYTFMVIVVYWAEFHEKVLAWGGFEPLG